MKRTLTQTINESTYYRVVAQHDEKVHIIANKVADNRYWLSVNGKIIREDLFTNDDVAKEYYGSLMKDEVLTF